MKKILISTLIAVSCLSLLTGCGTDEKSDNEISYTNKYECSRSVKYTKPEYDTSKSGFVSETPLEKEDLEIAVEGSASRVYDFNEEGSKLLAAYSIEEYHYLLDFDMEEEKAYFDKQCSKIDKKIYKSCKVSLEDKTITFTLELNIDSEYNKDHFGKLTLDHLKESFVDDVAYTCK